MFLTLTTGFFKDCTLHPPRSVDACLLDSDVLALMRAAYPETDLEELGSEYPEIMATFWSDIQHGVQVIQESAAAAYDDGNHTESSDDHGH